MSVPERAKHTVDELKKDKLYLSKLNKDELKQIEYVAFIESGN